MVGNSVRSDVLPGAGHRRPGRARAVPRHLGARARRARPRRARLPGAHLDGRAPRVHRGDGRLTCPSSPSRRTTSTGDAGHARPGYPPFDWSRPAAPRRRRARAAGVVGPRRRARPTTQRVAEALGMTVACDGQPGPLGDRARAAGRAAADATTAGSDGGWHLRLALLAALPVVDAAASTPLPHLWFDHADRVVLGLEVQLDGSPLAGARHPPAPPRVRRATSRTPGCGAALPPTSMPGCAHRRHEHVGLDDRPHGAARLAACRAGQDLARRTARTARSTTCSSPPSVDASARRGGARPRLRPPAHPRSAAGGR